MPQPSTTSRATIRIALLALLLAAASCATSGQRQRPRRPGSYDIVLQIPGEQVGATGTLYFDGDLEPGPISGQWEIRVPGEVVTSRLEADMRAAVGQMSGSGTFGGELEAGNLRLDLHPANRDNNILILARDTGRGYSGLWQYVTIAGPVASGPAGIER